MFVRAELKQKSKEQLKGKWAVTGGLFLLIFVAMIIVQFVPYLNWVVAIVIGGPVAVTYAIIALKVTRNETLKIDDTWSGFLNFGKAVGLYWWTILWVWLWSLLLIIPGIIKGISYSMAFYILADNPDMGVREALNESKRITQGYKWDLFVLSLSFIGWSILASLTLGIGYFWLIPYMQVTYANTYKNLSGKEY